jgi:predicted GNAT family acetyltransferase
VEIKRETRNAHGVRLSISHDGREIARAYLYVMTNDLHQAPFGLLEDVYVDESHRGAGLGAILVREVVGPHGRQAATSSLPLVGTRDLKCTSSIGGSDSRTMESSSE